MSSRPSPSVLELIGMRKWQKAMDIVSMDSETVYCTDGRYRRLVIHELCKMATTPPSIRQSKDEISDDERDEDDEAHADEDDDADLNVVTQHHEHVHEHVVNEEEDETTAHAMGAEKALDEVKIGTDSFPSRAHQVDASSCEECERELNAKLCELSQLMIDISHSLGPMRVLLATSEESESTLVDQGTDQTDEEFIGERGEKYRCHESILTVPDSGGKTPLHILCEGSCDIRMMRVIFGNTRESTGNPSAPTAMSLLMAKDSRGSTPLHYLAFSRQCPFSSLQFIMDLCKPVLTNDGDGIRIDPTLCCDSDGDTPLHWALDGYMSPRRIKELIRHSKDAIMALNNAGKRPFDQFAANFIDSEWKVHDVCGREVWDNIQAYLRVIFDVTNNNMQKDEDGKHSEWLPLHLLAGSPFDLPPIFTDIALHYRDDDLSKTNADGMLPLHLACRRRSINRDIPCDGSLALKILIKYPQAAYKGVTKSKRLGLHLAVATQKPMSLITALIKVYPRSLNSPDPITRLWPFVLAAVENEVSVGVSFTLLRADPSILHLAMKDEKRENNHRAKEMMRLMAEAELEDQSSRRIRRLTIRDPEG
ncbi:ankyrin repeat domain protein [Nitzschia inconspicua]|uniref:Ankyrin repeat domain protein n=1 Tax=Nitzschia inconspicua TaxID=303405 RepID=A0A9K3PPV6_9STRA|nr:ankyrin repeat domain protein [Nitzschia inconspicua]